MQMQIKNVDRKGKPIRGEQRIMFDGSTLLGNGHIEYGTFRYDRSRRLWMFVGDDGNEHSAVFDYELGFKCVFKYYEVVVTPTNVDGG